MDASHWNTEYTVIGGGTQLVLQYIFRGFCFFFVGSLEKIQSVPVNS